jgi:hypothetical protein
MPTLRANNPPLIPKFYCVYRKFSSVVSGILLFSFISWQCTKIDTTDIGGNLIPVVDNVNTFATELEVIANNYDSLITTPTSQNECAVIDRTDENILGYIGNDPYFGKTTASIFFQVLPPFIKFQWPVAKDSLFIDSVVLVLSYKKTYGDTIAMQRVNVQQVNATHNTFRPDSFYTSCNNFTGTGPLLGFREYQPRVLTDSQRLFKERANNQLRIKLDNTFGRQLLDQDTTGAFKTDSAFKAFFRGFALTPGTIGNAISYFNLGDTNTKLAIYYKYTRRVTGGRDTAVTYFRLANTGATANKIVRDHTGGQILNHLNPATPDSVIFLQTTPGTYALLKIPGLKTLSNRIIHRAELIVDQHSPTPSDAIFPPPEFLFLDVKDTGVNRYRAVPCDFNMFSGSPNISSFGGFKTSARDPFGNLITRYIFNLSRYTQNVVTKQQMDYTFRLSAPYNAFLSGYPSGYVDQCGQFIQPYNFGLNQTAFGRVKVGGGSSAHYKMKLRIIYSNL